MRIDGQAMRTIWPAADGRTINIIDQTLLPHRFEIIQLKTIDDAARAIKIMQVRGAPLIGATAAYGLCLGLLKDSSDSAILDMGNYLKQQRPTAVNLAWAVDLMTKYLLGYDERERIALGFEKAHQLCEADVDTNHRIGLHGLELIEMAAKGNGGEPVNILTHCNAGWLATVDWGTATSPIYQAHRNNIPVHVWIDETRPRNQGMALTAYELGQEGVPHTIIVDNAGGHLMQHGKVDLCIVGTDRTAANGDVANKIGTYLKALAAHDNNIPFYVALPSSTIDWELSAGFEIPIEGRGQDEILKMSGRLGDDVVTIDIGPEGSPAFNPAFDVTPAKYVTSFITEKGICPANRGGLANLFHQPA